MMMRDLLFSLRYAARTLRKQPAFTLVVLLILTLGIGANTILFSIAYNVLLRPLGYPEPERLVQLWPDAYIDKLIAVTVAERGRAFASVSPYYGGLFTLSGNRDAVVVKGARVGTDFFRVLAARPLLGRTFSGEEARPGEDRVVVLSDGLWRRQFGADRGILGRSVLIDGEAHTVLGVMGPDFPPLEPGWDLWLPVPIDPANVKDLQGSFYLKLVARLKPGVSARQAAEELRGLGKDLRATYPNLITPEILAAATAVPLQEHLVQAVRPILLVLLGSVGLVLLIVCGNVATLLLSRALRRRSELAIRAALGAARGRLVQEVATESLLLGLLGGAAGLALAFYGLKLLLANVPINLPRASEVAIDGPVLAFNLLLSLLAAIIFSLWPTRRALRFALVSELKAEGGGSLDRESRRFGRFLVLVQVAMAVVLLACAGLLLKSLSRLQTVDPGFNPQGLLTLRLDLPSVRYPDPPRIVDYYRRVVEQVAGLPGVESAAAIHLLPLTPDNWNFPYLAEDHPIPPGTPAGTALPEANFRVVTPGYFQTLGIRLREGRFFNAGDDAAGWSVGLINRTLAEQLWPGRGALGKGIRHFGAGGPSFTVIGVVEDVHQQRLDQAPRPEIYRPYTQWPLNSMYLVVRSGLPLAALAPALRSAIRKVDPTIAVADLHPFEEVLRRSISNERTTAFLLAAFAGFAFLLAILGLYGVISYTVRQRAREIEIRMALGAQRRHILQEILTEGLTVTTAGLAVGLAGALICARLLAGHLYQTSVMDGGNYLLVAALIVVSALGSIGLPAWRATRTARYGP
jgi:putative ABC transport system permease protein